MYVEYSITLLPSAMLLKRTKQIIEPSERMLRARIWNKSGIIGKHDDQIDDCYRLASWVVMRTRQDRKSEEGRENDRNGEHVGSKSVS